jgi:phosphatidylglycerol:prolipoprotein diacylglycerol transferase
MYLCGFAAGYYLALIRARRPGSGWNEEQVSDMVFYVAMGVILGGRIGYVLFYEFDKFLADPIWLFKLSQGGMSFHGGLLGVLVAVWLFCRKHQKEWVPMMDFVAPIVTPGLFFGRIGNFINGELWGRPVDDPNYPFGMVFQHVDSLPRHPSQLYEAGLEGVVLFIVLWWFSAKPRPRMAVSTLFLIGYGFARFTIEFFREPDADKGYFFGWMTEGQILCVPMIVIGIALFAYAYHRAGKTAGTPNATVS